MSHPILTHGTPTRTAHLRAFVREVANLLTLTGAADRESTEAALNALRLLGDDATAQDVLYLAASLATLYARAMAEAAYDTGGGVRAGRLAYVEQVGILAGRAFVLVMELASAERPGWRHESSARLRLAEDVQVFHSAAAV